MSEADVVPYELAIDGSLFARPRNTFEALNDAFSGAEVWKEYLFAARNREALCALQNEEDFYISFRLIRVTVWVVLADDRLMLWSRGDLLDAGREANVGVCPGRRSVQMETKHHPRRRRLPPRRSMDRRFLVRA